MTSQNLAPIWLPHWPVCKWTISRMLKFEREWAGLTWNHGDVLNVIVAMATPISQIGMSWRVLLCHIDSFTSLRHWDMHWIPCEDAWNPPPRLHSFTLNICWNHLHSDCPIVYNVDLWLLLDIVGCKLQLFLKQCRSHGVPDDLVALFTLFQMFWVVSFFKRLKISN